MHASTLRIALALASTLLATSLVCAQANINDCEKIQAADAYNQCLAKFGPPQKTQNLAPERPGDVKNSSEEAAAGAARGPGRARMSRRGGRRGSVRRAGGGRKRLVIAVRRRHR